MPANKIEGIPIQVFNFFLPSLSLTEIFALFILDNSLAYTGPPEILKMFWWFCFHFFLSIFWICVQFQNSWTSQLAIIFFLWRECRSRQCYRNYSWFTGGIKTFKGGLNCEKLYCPPNVNTWAMESFVVQFRKSKVSSHRRNVHVS